MKRLKRHVLSISFLLLFGIVMLGWRESTRFSERHIISLGTFSIDTFSASSLFRISFVKGDIATWDVATNYRHPNPRGKYLLDPVVPTFRKPVPQIFEITMGFWHLALFAFILAASTFGFERWRLLNPKTE